MHVVYSEVTQLNVTGQGKVRGNKDREYDKSIPEIRQEKIRQRHAR